MEGLLSVIVPVYNVELYIERCANSILCQSYNNIELILVDDGSTDSSGMICESIASKDCRVKVIHQENQGLGPARNTGLEVINGDYVTFVDSDDWVEPNTYELMIHKMITNGCDVSTCARNIVTDEWIIERCFCLESGMRLNNTEAVNYFLLQKNMNMSACDKVYVASLFEHTRFPGNFLVSEDIVPIYSVLSRARGIYLTGVPLYNYYYRDGSLSKTRFSTKTMGMVYYSEDVAKRVCKDFPDLVASADYFKIDQLITAYRILRRSKYSGEEKKELLQKLKDNFGKALKNEHLSLRHKVYIIMAVIGVDDVFDACYIQYKKTRMKWLVAGRRIKCH